MIGFPIPQKLQNTMSGLDGFAFMTIHRTYAHTPLITFSQGSLPEDAGSRKIVKAAIKVLESE
jgi:hypothetical protein